MRARVRSVLALFRFGAVSVRSALRKFYRARQVGRYLGRPGAHNLEHFRCPQKRTYFPAPTSAPGALWTTKPPPGGPNCVPGSLTYPLDTVVAADRRMGGLGSGRALLQISRFRSHRSCPNQEEEAIPVGRRARDAYRQVPEDAPPPRWSMGTNLGEESAEYGHRQSKNAPPRTAPRNATRCRSESI